MGMPPQKQKREAQPLCRGLQQPSAAFVRIVSSWRFRREALFNDRERPVFVNSRRRPAFLRERRFNLWPVRRICFYHENRTILAAWFRLRNRWRINRAIDA